MRPITLILIIGTALTSVAALLVTGVTLILLFVGGIFAVTEPAAQATNEFLGLVAAGKVGEAYQTSAVTMHNFETVDSFTAKMKQMGLTEFTSASWNSREMRTDAQGTRVTLRGTIQTKAGGLMALTVVVVKEANEWRVGSIQQNG